MLSYVYVVAMAMALDPSMIAKLVHFMIARVRSLGFQHSLTDRRGERRDDRIEDDRGRRRAQ